MSIANRLSEIEILIKANRLEDARRGLSAVFKKGVPRAHVAHAAHLARWAVMPDRALKLLQKYVRPSSGSLRAVSGSSKERAIFAAALVDLGACTQARELLSSMNPESMPEIYLYQARALARQWKWKELVSVTEAIMANGRVSTVDRIYAQTLHAAGLLRGKSNADGAAKILLETIEAVQDNKEFRYFLKDALQLLVEVQFLKKSYAEASASLDRLSRLVNEDRDPVFDIICAMWSQLLDLAKNGSREELVEQLQQTTARFKNQLLWEKARFCEFYTAVLLNDRQWLLKLFFATPYQDFRELVASRLTENPPSCFEIELGKTNGKLGAAFVNLQTVKLKAGQVPQRTLEILASDLYKPIQVAEFYSLLFPNEFYNPSTSPKRLHQAVFRLRQWLFEQGLPLVVAEEKGFYWLDASRPVVLKIHDSVAEARTGVDPALKKLLKLVRLCGEQYGDKPFSTTEYARDFNISYRTAARLLSEARQKNLLTRMGGGQSTRYKL